MNFEWTLDSKHEFPMAVEGPPPYGIWQRVTVVIFGGIMSLDPSLRTATDVRLTFDNVALFNFTQWEMQGAPIDIALDTGVPPRFYMDGLQDAGFIVREPITSHGAFCLWKSRASPVVDALVEAWNPSTGRDVLAGFLDHFRISSDEIGTIHVVCHSVSIERMARS